MFLDDQVFDSLHDELAALRHELAEHVDRLGAAAQVLAGAAGHPVIHPVAEDENVKDVKYSNRKWKNMYFMRYSFS